MNIDVQESPKTPNPKKRKAPDQREEDLSLKKPFASPKPSTAWLHPISTIDPSSMTLGEIEKEIQSVKSAISTVKEAIRLALVVH
jgi:hypothetical protein